MKDLLIVANWKANKTKQEALDFFEDLNFDGIDLETKQVVVCPPFTLLGKVAWTVSENNLDIKTGAQDVSSFPIGAYTGEVTAEQVKELADYVIIGHSERRENFSEEDSVLAKKVERAVDAGLTPIYCVSSADMQIPEGVSIVAYEPLAAIGTGNADSAEDVSSVAKEIKEKNSGVDKVLYGGSVNAENVHDFVNKDDIDGVLVGKESLNPSDFLSIIKNA